MRVAITGATGFLGQHVMRAAALAGHEAVPYHVTLRGPWFDSFDAVIHCAAACGGVGHRGSDGYRVLTANLELNQAVVDACVEAKVRLVAVSSVCAYPEAAPVPLREADLWGGALEHTVAGYGLAKRVLGEQCRLASLHRGLESVVLVPTNLYGPGDDYMHRNHLVSSLVRKVSAGGREVEVWGDGSATRDLLYVSDCAEACVRALTCSASGGELVNVGTGRETSVAELVGLLVELSGFPGAIEWDRTAPRGVPRRVMDIGRAAEMLDWHPRTSLRLGLASTLVDYRARVQP